MTNADIERDFKASGMSSIEEYLTNIAILWEKHQKLHKPGIQESLSHRVKRLVDMWENWQDLPDVYHDLSHEFLRMIQESGVRPAA